MSCGVGRALAGGRVQKARCLHGNAIYDVKTGTQVHSWRALPLPSSSSFGSVGAVCLPLSIPSNESRTLRALKHPYIIRHLRSLLAPEADALYLITEPLPDRTLTLILQTAIDDDLVFREGFLWSALHQLASACKALQNIQIQFFAKRFYPDRVYVYSDNKIKIDPFQVSELEKSSERFYPSCSNDICSVASLINHLTTETKQPFNNFRDVLNDLLHSSKITGCQILPDIVLHHPAVLFNIDDSNEILIARTLDVPKIINDSAFESDDSSLKLSFIQFSDASKDEEEIKANDEPEEVIDNICNLNKVYEKYQSNRNLSNDNLSPTLKALDLKIPGYVPPKREGSQIWNSRTNLNREPKEVSEETLNRVWLERLTNLRNREEALKLKEKEIAKKEIFEKVRAEIRPINSLVEVDVHDVSIKSLSGITLQPIMSAKKFPILQNNDNMKSSIENKILSYEDNIKNLNTNTKSVVSKRSHRSNSTKRMKKKAIRPYEDMDSSLSADPGDTSICPTSTKLSAEIVPRPSGIQNLSRRKVHFNHRKNPFAEYESISSTTLTFVDGEELNASYEVPRKVPMKTENINDEISKFSYFDLEAMTNEKRALMMEWRKSPPKPKPALKTQTSLLNNDFKEGNTVTIRKSRRQKYFSPKLSIYSSMNQINYNSSQSESSYKSVKSLPSIPTTTNEKKSSRNITEKQAKSSKSVLNQIERINTRASFYCNRLRDNIKNKNENKVNTDEDIKKSSKDDPDIQNKENILLATPANLKKRKSILGFKTPFSFKF